MVFIKSPYPGKADPRYYKKYKSRKKAERAAEEGDVVQWHSPLFGDDYYGLEPKEGIWAAEEAAAAAEHAAAAAEEAEEEKRRLRRQHAATLADEAAAARDNAIVRREETATRRDDAAANAIAAITRRIEQGDLDKGELDALTAALKALK